MQNFAEGKCNNRRLNLVQKTRRTIAEDKSHFRRQEERLQKTKFAEDNNHCRRQNSLQNAGKTIAEDKNSLQNTRRTIAED